MTGGALGIGELLWDELPDGARLGGAPFNVIANLSRLGHRAAYATAVGRDVAGDAALAELRRRGIETTLVTRAELPTGAARVVLAADGTPGFEIVSPAAYEAFAFDAAMQDQAVAAAPRIVVFGTLAQRFPAVRAATAAVLDRLAAPIRIYDVNLREGCWSPELVAELAGLATVLKLSEAEAELLAPYLVGDWNGVEGFSRRAAARFGLRAVAITAGAGTAALLLDDTFATAEPPAVTVVDAVGAGDAFAAGLADALDVEVDAETALRRANALGALAASQAGALPAWTRAQLAALDRELEVTEAPTTMEQMP